MKLNIKKDYVLCEFYEFGHEDTFDFFYYRNHKLFIKNDFYKDHNWIIGYGDELYQDEEKILIKANIIKKNKFILPKGTYDLNEINNTWELKINGVTLSNLKNLLDDSLWSYNTKIINYMEIIQ